MIILSIRLGRFSILGQRETDSRFSITHEPGEVTVALLFVRLFLSNYSRAIGVAR